MAADFSKPTTNSTKLGFPQEIVDNFGYVSTMAEGTPAVSNIPTNAKRLESSTGEVFNWNGSSWVSIGFISLTRDPVGDITDGAPAALDTLNELAAALADDENFASTVTTSLDQKMVKSQNLNDVSNKATSRTNLDVYSKGEVNSLISGVDVPSGYTEYWVNTTGNGNGLSSGSPMALQTFFETILGDPKEAKNVMVHIDVPLLNVGAGDTSIDIVGKNIIFLAKSSGSQILPRTFVDCNIILASEVGGNNTLHFASPNSNALTFNFINCRISGPSGLDDFPHLDKIVLSGDLTLDSSSLIMTNTDIEFDGNGALYYDALRVYRNSSMYVNIIRNASDLVSNGTVESSLIIAENSNVVCEQIYFADPEPGGGPPSCQVNTMLNSSLECKGDILCSSMSTYIESLVRAEGAVTLDYQQGGDFCTFESRVLINGQLDLSNRFIDVDFYSRLGYFSVLNSGGVNVSGGSTTHTSGFYKVSPI